MDRSRQAEPLVSVESLCAESRSVADRRPGEEYLTVMTQNLYCGADLAPVVTAASAAGVAAGVASVWDAVQTTNFPDRAEALARIIEKWRPDVLALQEAVRWWLREAGPSTLHGSSSPAVLDYLAILLEQLWIKGVPYRVLAAADGVDAEFPMLGDLSLRLTDRNVILVRQDAPCQPMGALKPSVGRYATNFIHTIGGEELIVFRSWAAADLSVGGKTIRVITTHLEPHSVEIQRDQAQEMVRGPADTRLPVLLLGDFNCLPDLNAPTYRTLVDAGFEDTWPLSRPPVGGHTCCQRPDLQNCETALSSRVDLILVRGPWQVREVTIVGGASADRSRGGLWPSDHAGVVAILSTNEPTGRACLDAPEG